MPTTDAALSSYLHHLPSLFSEDVFLGRFLLAFEQVLTGVDAPEGAPAQGLEQTIAAHALVGGSVPHHFHVTVAMAAPDPARALRQRQIVTALVNLEKPAHTYYDLTITFSTMQIGVRSTIGVDTLLGNLPAAPA